MNKKTKVISGFPGVGKTKFFKSAINDNTVILDSDSSNFSWLPGKMGIERDPDFPNNYISHIKANMGKADYILVSSHQEVRDKLREEDIIYYLVYPALECKSEYLERYRRRGSKFEFIQFMNKNWENFIKQLVDDPYPRKVELSQFKQYLSHVAPLLK